MTWYHVYTVPACKTPDNPTTRNTACYHVIQSNRNRSKDKQKWRSCSFVSTGPVIMTSQLTSARCWWVRSQPRMRLMSVTADTWGVARHLLQRSVGVSSWQTGHVMVEKYWEIVPCQAYGHKSKIKTVNRLLIIAWIKYVKYDINMLKLGITRWRAAY